jgi:hypothetical protein
MDTDLEAKIRGAAWAAWWTAAVGYAALLASYALFLYGDRTHAPWVVSLFGDGVAWEAVRGAWVVGLIAFKLVVGTIVLGALFLTLWARRMTARESVIGYATHTALRDHPNDVAPSPA